MSILILDHEYAKHVRREREATDAAQRDEVWDGVYVVSPLPNNEHQKIVARLTFILQCVVSTGEGDIFAGVNISDRESDWTENYRQPDVAAFLNGNPARDRGAYWQGGPDFAVEILSPGDRARGKLDFYSSVGVRELLVVDRDPWALELYRHDGKRLALVGNATPRGAETVTSEVLGLAFQLVPCEPRPTILITRASTGTSWRA